MFSEDDFQHWFLPRDTIVDCYVIQDESTGAITDMMSYYALPSTVMNHPTHKSLRAAYREDRFSGNCEIQDTW